LSLLVTGRSDIALCDLRRGGMASLVPRPGDTERMTIDWLARPRLIRRMTDR
jgi:hypothetical protein